MMYSLNLMLLAVSLSLGASEKIWEGERVKKGDWPGTLAVTAYSSLQQKYLLKCTGVLIHPRVVLTAAHCIQKDLDLNPRRFYRDYGIYSGEGQEGGELRPQYKIARAFYHPHFKKSMVGYKDLAVLLLQEDLSHLPLVKVAQDPTEIYLRALVPRAVGTIVGFGKRENGRWGEKFQASLRIESGNSGEWLLQGPENGSSKDSCNGDSGGPFYGMGPDGTPWVLGLASRGIAKDCGAGSFYTLISDSLCWIREVSDLPLFPAYPCGEGEGEEEVQNQDEVGEEYFIQDCLRKDLPFWRKHTYSLLLSLAGSAAGPGEETVCQEAFFRLKDLTILRLPSAFLQDVSPLVHFKNLETLDLQDNRIASPEVLRPLKNLKVLNLTSNRIPPAQWEKLREWEQGPELYVYGKKFQQDSFFDTVFLSLCRKGGASATVAALKQLVGAISCEEANFKLLRATSLDLSGRELSDLSPLQDLLRLKELHLRKNQFQDITPLASLENLQYLDVRENHIADFSPLESLPGRSTLVVEKDGNHP